MKRQINREGRALGRRAVNVDAAVVAIDDPFHEAQSETGTFGAMRSRRVRADDDELASDADGNQTTR